MDTTIQISNELLQRLKGMKIANTESYESIIWDLIEDRLEFSKQTKENLAKSEREIAGGKTISLEELKKKVGA
jgi:predicted CopG family antitoxin